MKYLSLRRSLKLIPIIILINLTALYGQESSSMTPDRATDPDASRLSPVFPDAEKGLIYVEGESAVSTNFSTSPVYNYGASGFKSLQLIQQNASYGGQAYFAEYAFYVEEEGDYAFWYGGTPAGPKDTVYPSFSSPFRYILDKDEPVSVYRENIAVNSAYTPAYYWMEVRTVHLTHGVHRIRFEVSEKRRYDGQFYFFLDAFFFLRQDRMEDSLTLVPDVFPRNRLDRSIDNPFRSFSYYDKIIKEHPGNKNAYIMLSMVYSLAGDYINALKNLNKAVSLDPNDPYPLLLTAKNRIWNGEISEGIAVYRQLLTLAPDNSSYWAEAGKVAAWTGNYRASIDFFTRGLKIFPENLNLKVNLGLTYLWMSRLDDAENIFKDAENSTTGNHAEAMDLGNIHKLNGYPQYAVNIYKKELVESPEHLDTYLNLEESFRQLGETKKADEVIKKIYDSFEQTPALSRFMNVYEEKKSMKDGILQDYLDALAKQPDNIPLRQLLSQTYFWNGLKEEAVDQSLKILVNKLYISMREFDDKSVEILSFMDELSLYRQKYQQIEEAYLKGIKDLTSSKSDYEKAKGAADKKPDDETLKARLEEASSKYAESYKINSLWSYRMGELDKKKMDLEEMWSPLLEKETEDEKVFRQLLGDSGWSWDRLFNQKELRQVQHSEPFLTGYVLSRLALFSGKPEEAARILGSDVFREDSQALYGRYEAYLWGMDEENRKKIWSDNRESLTLYRSSLTDLEGSTWAEDESHFSTLPPIEQTNALIEELTLRSRTMKTEIEDQNRLANDVLNALDRKLVRQIYYYEKDTYLLRYSLGEYYLDMGKNLEATGQFERVLAMDPTNISANYKLGIVSQRYGDWFRAMKQYKKVYYQNPDYENASYYYNQLARQNADAVSLDMQNITDTTRIKYLGTFNYQTKVNTWLGWGMTYHLDMNRKYRVFNPEIPNQYKLHTIGINTPLFIKDWNFTITPVAGFYAWNDYFGVSSSDPGFGTSVPTPQDLGSVLNLEPLLGVSLGWKKSFLDTSLSYKYRVEEESVFTDRTLARSHFFSAAASTYFPLDTLFDWGPVTTRTYGQMDFLSDKSGGSRNFKGQIIQEGSIGYVMNRVPLVRLTVNGILNFENGSDSDITDYYLPQGVLEAKGGLRGTVNFHKPDYSEALELSLYGSAGGYWMNLLKQENRTQSLKMEGMFSLYYVKETMTLFLNIGGNGTIDENNNLSFWEFSTLIGARINVPSLLAK